MPVRSNIQGKIRIGDWISQKNCEDLEVIIVQDCTTPTQGSELRNTIKSLNLPYVRYIEGNFGNPGSARNAGLISASCEWIAFWDADDLPNIESFLDILELAKAAESQVIIGSFSLWSDRDGNKVSTHEINSSPNLLIELALRPGIWRIALKKNDFAINRFPSSSMGEDQVYISSLSIFDKKIFKSNEKIYNYFLGVPGQLTSNKSSMNDMKYSIRELEHHRNAQKGNSQKLTEFYIFKQCLTCLKRGSLDLKIWALGKLLISCAKYPVSFVQIMSLLGKGK